MKIGERLKLIQVALAGAGRAEIDEDSIELRADADGYVRQPCWFCNRDVEFQASALSGDAAIVMIQPLGADEHVHGVCHRDCDERSRGSLAL